MLQKKWFFCKEWGEKPLRRGNGTSLKDPGFPLVGKNESITVKTWVFLYFCLAKTTHLSNIL